MLTMYSSMAVLTRKNESYPGGRSVISLPFTGFIQTGPRNKKTGLPRYIPQQAGLNE